MGITSLEFADSAENSAQDSSELLTQCVAELTEYFNNERKEFSVPLHPHGTDFQNDVWEHLLEIPFGKTISYEQLALRMGDIKKIRAVAQANGHNPIPILIPCHRVISKDGTLGGYSSGLTKKEWLLKHEGVLADQVSLF